MRDYYEQALRLSRIIRQLPHIEEFTIDHVHREYNADADGTANEAIDLFQSHLHMNGIVILDSWLQTDFAQRLNDILHN